MGKRKRQNIKVSEEVVASNGHTSDVTLNDDESDDDLPCVLSPTKRKNGNEFKRGDMIFAKFSKYPFWPGLFYKYATRKKKKVAWVYFFESSPFDEEKRIILPVTLSNLKSFTCEEKNTFLEAGLKDPNFASSLEKANEYSMKKASKKIIDFFERVEENCDSDDVVDGDDFHGNHVSTNPCDVEQFKDGGSDMTKSPPSSRKSLFIEKRTSKRQQGKKRKELINWIYQNGRELLNEIESGTRKSLRRETFVSGTQKDRDHLKWISGYGPIQYGDDESDEDVGFMVAERLVSWYTEDHPNTDHNSVTYVHDVWLPEVIIHAMADVRKISYEEAEEQFLDGS